MNKFIAFICLCFLFYTSNGQTITTITGDGTFDFSGDGGPAASAKLNRPNAVAADTSGNIYIADMINNRIRKVSISGVITTMAGNGGTGFSGDGGPATNAELNYPTGVAVDRHGNIYVAQDDNNCIRKINSDGIISTYAGRCTSGGGGYSGDGGPATAAKMLLPLSLAVDTACTLYVTESLNNIIRKIDVSGIISTYAGQGITSSSVNGIPATAATFESPNGVAVDNYGNVFVSEGNLHIIRRIDTAGIINIYAGNYTGGFSGDNGPATAAELMGNSGMTCDIDGNLYVCDNNRVRKIYTSGTIATIAGGGTLGLGDGGPAKLCKFNAPVGVILDKAGNIYVAENEGSRVRKIQSTLGTTSFENHFDLVLFPNPSEGNFRLRINTDQEMKIPVHIISSFGRLVKSFYVTTNQDNDISFSALPGIYFVRAELTNGAVTESIVIR